MLCCRNVASFSLSHALIRINTPNLILDAAERSGRSLLLFFYSREIAVLASPNEICLAIFPSLLSKNVTSVFLLFLVAYTHALHAGQSGTRRRSAWLELQLDFEPCWLCLCPIIRLHVMTAAGNSLAVCSCCMQVRRTRCS